MDKPMFKSWTVWGAILLGLSRVLAGVVAYVNGDQSTGLNEMLEGVGIALGGAGLRRAIGPAAPMLLLAFVVELQPLGCAGIQKQVDNTQAALNTYCPTVTEADPSWTRDGCIAGGRSILAAQASLAAAKTDDPVARKAAETTAATELARAIQALRVAQER